MKRFRGLVIKAMNDETMRDEYRVPTSRYDMRNAMET